MESRFSLRQVDEILRNAFLLQDGQDHLAITARASEGALENAASAIGEIRDIARDLVGHHQRQVGAGMLDSASALALVPASAEGARPLVGSIGAGSDFCSVPGAARSLFSAAGIEIVHTLDDPVEFLSRRSSERTSESAGQKTVECIIEILLGVVGLWPCDSRLDESEPSPPHRRRSRVTGGSGNEVIEAGWLRSGGLLGMGLALAAGCTIASDHLAAAAVSFWFSAVSGWSLEELGGIAGAFCGDGLLVQRQAHTASRLRTKQRRSGPGGGTNRTSLIRCGALTGVRALLNFYQKSYLCKR